MFYIYLEYNLGEFSLLRTEKYRTVQERYRTVQEKYRTVKKNGELYKDKDCSILFWKWPLQNYVCAANKIA